MTGQEKSKLERDERLQRLGLRDESQMLDNAMLKDIASKNGDARR